uniref:Uncharacterized protein n=1 Tax=Cacopsylla melanoneura TaxID=428564 RepID=A0A8D8RTC3_9HEMI
MLRDFDGLQEWFRKRLHYLLRFWLNVTVIHTPIEMNRVTLIYLILYYFVQLFIFLAKRGFFLNIHIFLLYKMTERKHDSINNIHINMRVQKNVNPLPLKRKKTGFLSLG